MFCVVVVYEAVWSQNNNHKIKKSTSENSWKKSSIRKQIIIHPLIIFENVTITRYERSPARIDQTPLSIPNDPGGPRKTAQTPIIVSSDVSKNKDDKPPNKESIAFIHHLHHRRGTDG